MVTTDVNEGEGRRRAEREEDKVGEERGRRGRFYSSLLLLTTGLAMVVRTNDVGVMAHRTISAEGAIGCSIGHLRSCLRFAGTALPLSLPVGLPLALPLRLPCCDEADSSDLFL